jgi:ATP-dependent Clp protease ATP-binding subunit ClpC
VFERFTERARRVLTLAQEEARQLNHSFIGTEHILLGLISEGDGVGAEALRSLGISFQAVRDQIQETIGTAGTIASGSPPFTPRAKKVLELALREALQLNHSYIGTEHILLGLVREGEGVAATVLLGLGADLPRVRREVNNLMSGAEERQGVGRVGAPALSSVPREPRCPRCSRNVSEAARFRTIVVAPDEGSADPLPMHLVYCAQCGTVLHMLKADVAS